MATLPGNPRRFERWSVIVWPLALALIAADLTHTQVHAMLFVASGLALLVTSRFVTTFGSTYRAGWALVVVGQAAEAIGAGLDAHRGASGESVHSAGQLIGLLSVVALLAAVVRPLPGIPRERSRVASRLLPLAAAVSILGLQSGAALALALVPATSWAAMAAFAAPVPGPPHRNTQCVPSLRPSGQDS